MSTSKAVEAAHEAVKVSMQEDSLEVAERAVRAAQPFIRAQVLCDVIKLLETKEPVDAHPDWSLSTIADNMREWYKEELSHQEGGSA